MVLSLKSWVLCLALKIWFSVLSMALNIILALGVSLGLAPQFLGTHALLLEHRVLDA